MFHQIPASSIVLITAASASFTADRPEHRHAFAGGAAEVRALDDAIEQLVAEMSFIKRPFARSKLRARAEIAPFVQISRQGATLAVRHGERPPMIAKIGGPAERWTAPDGDVLSVRHELEGGALVQRIFAGAAVRTNRFELRPAGRLIMEVEIQASALPRPLRYRLSYALVLPEAR